MQSILKEAIIGLKKQNKPIRQMAESLGVAVVEVLHGE